MRLRQANFNFKYNLQTRLWSWNCKSSKSWTNEQSIRKNRTKNSNKDIYNIEVAVDVLWTWSNFFPISELIEKYGSFFLDQNITLLTSFQYSNVDKKMSKYANNWIVLISKTGVKFSFINLPKKKSPIKQDQGPICQISGHNLYHQQIWIKLNIPIPHNHILEANSER